MGPDLPQRTNLGSQLGQAIGGGLERGLNVSLNTQYERGLLQNALNQARDAYNKSAGSPIDQAFALSNLLNIPGGEKAIAAFAPLLIQQGKANRFADINTRGSLPSPIAGQPANQGALGQSGQPVNNNPNVVNPDIVNRNVLGAKTANEINNAPIAGSGTLPLTPPSSRTPGVTPTLGGTTVAGLPRILSNEEIDQAAKQAAIASADPNAYTNMQNALLQQNEEARRQQADPANSQAVETQRQADIIARDNQLRTFAAQTLPGLAGEELNDFMRIGQRYSNLNPADWLEATRKDFDKMNLAKTAIEKAYVPGEASGLVRGGKFREEQLQRLTPQVQSLIKYGKETYARNALTRLGVTMTEFEKMAHPINESTQKNINALPKSIYPSKKDLDLLHKPWIAGEYIYDTAKQALNPKKYQEGVNHLTDFIRQNAPGNSLLALRDDITNKKDYDWTQYWDGLQNAIKEGLQLTPSQEAELEDLRNPPKDTLPNIFRGLGNFLQFFQGAK